VTWASYVGVRRPHWPKRPIHGALAAKPEVEVWRRPVFFTQRPRRIIRLCIHYGVYLAPLRLHWEIIVTLAHCNGRRTKISHGQYYSRNWPISQVCGPVILKQKIDTPTKLAVLVVLIG